MRRVNACTLSRTNGHPKQLYRAKTCYYGACAIFIGREIMSFKMFVAALLLLSSQGSLLAQNRPAIPGSVDTPRRQEPKLIEPTRPSPDVAGLQACLDACREEQRRCQAARGKNCNTANCRSDCRKKHALKPSPTRIPLERK